MHEFSMISALVESVREYAAARQIRSVTNVRLAVGELTRFEAEQLRFCYAALCEETEMAGSKLEIDTVPAEVKCPHCSYIGKPKYWEDVLSQTPVPTLQCPGCGKAAEAIQGHECTIKTIQYAA